MQRQRGAFAVITAVLILVIMGFCGLAIDVGRVLNRKVELQSAADTIALFAARELDGTEIGVNNANKAALQLASGIFYSYTASNVEWSSAAISFGATPYGDVWLDATEAAKPVNAPHLFYVRVDTSRLAASHGTVPLTLLRVIPSISSAAQVSGTATAGRSSINVMPLAICAMSETAGEARGTELVEYGFRRGVSYDLMQLNPKSNAKGANYLVNPIALPGTTGVSMMGKMDVVRPYVCTGKLAMPNLAGASITVEPDFPLSSVYEQLNSRFGSYTAPCTATTAPRDTNIKEYTFSADFPWMNDTPAKQSAETATTVTKLLTIADLPSDDIPATTTPDKFGPLWVYAKAVKYASYKPGLSEPSGGYATFDATDTDLATLYTPGSPKIKPGTSYPTPSPYGYAPNSTVSNKRRILNIPLLRCPVSTGSPASAEVLAIAKFFMTVKAKDKELYAEFTGVAPPTSLIGEVELYP
jgi:hypothetical protein